jgi:dynein heavy chain
MADFEFKMVVDIFVLSAMGMPGGGRSVISNRLVRHSNVMAYTNMTDASIISIYKGIVEGF